MEMNFVPRSKFLKTKCPQGTMMDTNFAPIDNPLGIHFVSKGPYRIKFASSNGEICLQKSTSLEMNLLKFVTLAFNNKTLEHRTLGMNVCLQNLWRQFQHSLGINIFVSKDTIYFVVVYPLHLKLMCRALVWAVPAESISSSVKVI